MAQGSPIQVHKFDGSPHPLSEIADRNRQAQYLRCYFGDLNATTIIEEPSYFDRDYLAEFAAFYSVSSKGYPNHCKRLHFFSGKPFSKRLLRNAASGNISAQKRLNDHYLGFVVVRPIPAAPLGRTVVRWYDDEQEKTTPRVVEPSRDYRTHVAGVELTVHGLAWQQQDTGVGACATVGLWSMLHSSAFDDHHAVPTTAEITRAANKKLSFGARIFPSTGLTIHQICEAIKEFDLSPLVIEGDLGRIGFSHERLASSCAAFLRTGYPVLLVGNLDGSGHAVCVVGFRSGTDSSDHIGVRLEDSSTSYLYIHDDNLGPNVRFRLDTVACGEHHVAVLSPVAPPARSARGRTHCPTEDYPVFVPTQLVVAAHSDLRTSPDTLHRAGFKHALGLQAQLESLSQIVGSKSQGLTVSTKFMKLSDYLGKELARTLASEPRVLGDARLQLCEQIPRMSLHIGIVRIGLDDSTPLMDVLYDTTDSDRNHPVYGHVAYQKIIPLLVTQLQKAMWAEYGVCIRAYGT